MRSSYLKLLLILGFLAFAPLAYGQGTFTPSTCNGGDILAAITGSSPFTPGSVQHVAVNGDTISVPATANCTWPNVLSLSVCISIIGQGTPGANGAGASAPVITLPTGNTNAFINNNGGTAIPVATVSGKPCITRISNITFLPASTTFQATQVFFLVGVCNSTTCPYLRIDHNTFGSATQWWARINTNDWRVRIDNFFGVTDHNTIFSDSIPWYSPGNPSWNGVGGPNGCANSATNGCGDQSWTSLGTYGAALDSNGVPKSFYHENENMTWTNGTPSGSPGWLADCTNYGCRRVERFNTYNNGHTDGHGTETGGRQRGQRAVEIYGGTFNMDCAKNNAGTINAYMIARSGNVFGYGNTLAKLGTCGAQPWTVGINLETFRVSGAGSYAAFGNCDGTSPMDKNDGAVKLTQGTLTAAGAMNISNSVMTDTTASFPNLAPGGATYYTFYDAQVGEVWDIVSSTATSVTIVFSRPSNSGVAAKAGDTYYIFGTTSYVYSTATSTAVGVLNDNTKAFTANQWVGYSIHDATTGSGNQILSNTATSATFVQSTDPNSGSNITITVGDKYAITRATACTDQAGRESGAFLGGKQAVIAQPVNEFASPTYEWMDNFTGTPAPSGLIGLTPATNANTVSNRDYYQMLTFNQAKQASPTSPFNGTSAIGWGTLANRPTTCTPGTGGEAGVGYWAEDQGNWNTSSPLVTFPDGSSQGQLYVCQASNVSPVDVNGAATTCTAAGSNFWCLWYKPAPYPHPLIAGLSPAPFVSISPSPVAFGQQQQGTSSSPMTVTVTNTGNATLTLSTPFFTISGTNAADFSESAGTCVNGGSVLASGSCTLAVTFTPSTAAFESATLTINGNASGSASLTGSGTVGAGISLSPTSLTFGGVVLGVASATQNITVTNTGTANLIISSIVVGCSNCNPGPWFFAAAGTSCNLSGQTVAPAASCVLVMQMIPGAITPFIVNGTVTITDNAAGSPHTIPLSGFGIANNAPSPAGVFGAANLAGCSVCTGTSKCYCFTQDRNIYVSKGSSQPYTMFLASPVIR